MCRLLVGGLEAVALVRVLVSLVDGDVPGSSSNAAEALQRMSTAFATKGSELTQATVKSLMIWPLRMPRSGGDMVLSLREGRQG